MSHQFPRKLEQNVIVQHIDRETLVYDESRHRAFCLNPTSAAVWNLSDGERSPEQIAQEACRLLAAPVDAALVVFTLAELRRDALLLDPVSAMPAPVSRRAMLQSLGATSALLLPAVAVILAPKAAQAYGGCFDCSSSLSAQHRMQMRREASQAEQENRKQMTGVDLGK